MKKKIPYTRPSITDLEIENAADAVSNGWGEDCYRYIDLFEQSLREKFGATFAIATSSCTGALHLGLAAIGVGHGDEVILADTNWVATVAPVVHLGAKPVFVDIDPVTWCIDPSSVKSAITKKTKAIIATHLYGNLCDMDELTSLASENNVLLIEDAAEAWGSIYFGSPAGSIAEFGVFSFHGSKTLTTGEGGALITNNKDFFDQVTTLSNHGRESDSLKEFRPTYIGYKFKMSNVQASLGVAQILRSEELVTRRREILDVYRNKFFGIDGISLNPKQKGCESGAWMPTLSFSNLPEGKCIEPVISSMRKKGIDVRPVFPPLSELDPFDLEPCKNAKRFSEVSLNLPSFHDISDEEIDFVVDAVKSEQKNLK
ncbi:MAG: DegT/DnrJ/EryC1/StrS family aminotransferase [Acidimicrobiales bacterium]|nr:DegT/DnrJ/EryC1/StrS family aminotransferase [Acidimicrobiales bacterium]